LIISHSILLGIRNVSDKSWRNETYFLNSIIIFENCAIYEITWKNVELGRPQMMMI
jgi:hypothetical protein